MIIILLITMCAEIQSAVQKLWTVQSIQLHHGPNTLQWKVTLCSREESRFFSFFIQPEYISIHTNWSSCIKTVGQPDSFRRTDTRTGIQWTGHTAGHWVKPSVLCSMATWDSHSCAAFFLLVSLCRLYRSNVPAFDLCLVFRLRLHLTEHKLRLIFL